MQSEVISPKPKSGQEERHHLYLPPVSPIWMRCSPYSTSLGCSDFCCLLQDAWRVASQLHSLCPPSMKPILMLDCLILGALLLHYSNALKTMWKIAPFPSSAHAKILGALRCGGLPLLGVRQPTNCQCTYLIIVWNAKVCTGWAVLGAPRVVWWSSIGVEREHTHSGYLGTCRRGCQPEGQIAKSWLSQERNAPPSTFILAFHLFHIF